MKKKFYSLLLLLLAVLTAHRPQMQNGVSS